MFLLFVDYSKCIVFYTINVCTISMFFKYYLLQSNITSKLLLYSKENIIIMQITLLIGIHQMLMMEENCLSNINSITGTPMIHVLVVS